MDEVEVSHDLITCSFRGKDQHAVKKIIAGPDAHYCDECVALCNGVLVQDLGAQHLVPDFSTGAS